MTTQASDTAPNASAPAAPAPDEPANATDTSRAPASDGTSAPSTEATAEDTFHELSLDDMPEEVRAYARAVEARMKAAYTRKTQDLAAQRREAEQALELVRRLGSDDTREQALAELLAEYGYEFEDYGEDYGDGGEGGEQPPYDPRVDELIAERDAEREAQRQAELASAVEGAVNTGLTTYEAELGRSLSGEERELVLHFAVKHTQPGELPNMEAAVAEHRAYLATLEQQAIERYVKSKRVPSADVTGVSGAPDKRPVDTRSRIERGLEVAGRHL